MNYMEKLDELISKNDGLLFTKNVTEADIPREYIIKLVKQGRLTRIDRGVYITKDGVDDGMYRLQSRYPSIIFSHRTALFFHGLIDTVPPCYTITVPAEYNASKIKDSGVNVFSIKYELFELGLLEGKTHSGRTVRYYDQERSICDILRGRKKDAVLINDVLKNYIEYGDNDMKLLMSYAEDCKITKVLTKYLDALT